MEWIPPPQLALPGGGVNDYHHPDRLLGETSGQAAARAAMTAS